MKDKLRAVAAAGGLVLFAAGCGGGPAGGHAAPASGSRAEQQTGVLAFSRCMRSHGVPGFPDPDSSGGLPKRQVARLTGSPQFPAAHRSCEHLLPNGGQPTQAQVLQAWADMRSFARCMRAHGVPAWPDPAPTSQQDQRPFFHLPASIDPEAPRITARIGACQHVLHAGDPLVTTQ